MTVAPFIAALLAVAQFVAAIVFAALGMLVVAVLLLVGGVATVCIVGRLLRRIDSRPVAQGYVERETQHY